MNYAMALGVSFMKRPDQESQLKNENIWKHKIKKKLRNMQIIMQIIIHEVKIV